MSIKQINTNNAPSAIGPYSQAIQVGEFLFSSGQIPINSATGEVVEGNIEAQTIQVLTNIAAIINNVGLEFSDIVKTTVFLKDLKDFSKVNDVYAEYFTAPYPARSCVEVARLPKDVLVEIEFIASVKK